MDESMRLEVVFFRSTSGGEPVRDWLKALDQSSRKSIGEDIKTVQFGWPLGMPLVKKIDADLWEVRSQLNRRTARVIFTVQSDYMVLLHAFIRKSQKTPPADLNTARKRLAQLLDSSR
jgi:phage-related protein